MRINCAVYQLGNTLNDIPAAAISDALAPAGYGTPCADGRGSYGRVLTAAARPACAPG